MSKTAVRFENTFFIHMYLFNTISQPYLLPLLPLLPNSDLAGQDNVDVIESIYPQVKKSK